MASCWREIRAENGNSNMRRTPAHAVMKPVIPANMADAVKPKQDKTADEHVSKQQIATG